MYAGNFFPNDIPDCHLDPTNPPGYKVVLAPLIKAVDIKSVWPPVGDSESADYAMLELSRSSSAEIDVPRGIGAEAGPVTGEQLCAIHSRGEQQGATRGLSTQKSMLPKVLALTLETSKGAINELKGTNNIE